MGRIIPAGTGFIKYRNYDMNPIGGSEENRLEPSDIKVS